MPPPSEACNLSRSRPRCPLRLSLKLTARLNGADAVAIATAPLGPQAAVVTAEAAIPATVVAAALATTVVAATTANPHGADAMEDMAAASADTVVTEAVRQGSFMVQEWCTAPREVPTATILTVSQISMSKTLPRRRALSRTRATRSPATLTSVSISWPMRHRP